MRGSKPMDEDDGLTIGVAAKAMIDLHENPYEEADRLCAEARRELGEQLRARDIAIAKGLEVKLAIVESSKKRAAEPDVEYLDPLRMGEDVLRNTGPHFKKRLTLTRVLENYAEHAGYTTGMAFSKWIVNVDKKLCRIDVTSVHKFVIMAPQINELLKSHRYKQLHGFTIKRILILCVNALHHYEIDGLKKCHLNFTSSWWKN